MSVTVECACPTAAKPYLPACRLAYWNPVVWEPNTKKWQKYSVLASNLTDYAYNSASSIFQQRRIMNDKIQLKIFRRIG